MDSKPRETFAPPIHLTIVVRRLAGWMTDSVITAVILTVCLIVGYNVRCEGLDSRSMWFDESYTWRMAFHSPAEILHRLRLDNSPPLYYLLLKYWMEAFGIDAVAARSLSVVSGLAAIIGIFLFTRELLTGSLANLARVSRRETFWAPLLAAAFLALNPLQIRYSWEARMYSLGAALAAFSGWAMVRAIDPVRPRWGRWMVYAAIAIVFAYSHTFALLTIAVEGVVVAWWLCEQAGGSPLRIVRLPAFRSAVVAFGLIALGFAFWIPTLRVQLATPMTRDWIPQLTTYHQLYTVCFNLFVDPSGPTIGFNSLRCGAVIAALALAAAWRGRWIDGVILALGFGPIVLAAAVSLTVSPVLIVRYFVFAQPFLLVMLAVAVARVRNSALFTAAAVTMVVMSSYCCHDFLHRVDLDRFPGFRGAAAYLDEHRQPNEPVLCSDGHSYFPILCHIRDRSRVFVVSHREGWVVGDTALNKDREVLSPAEVAGVAQEVVWVVNRMELSEGKVVAAVPVPESWREASRMTYDEPFGMGAVVVIRYLTPGAGSKQSNR